MLNYGMYQMADETGMPQHYLLDTVDCTSSNADSSFDSQSQQHMRRDHSIYTSQRASLFEEFVDQTEMNFSQSEFDKSISLIEFTIQSQIFTRKHIPEKKKSIFSLSKQKAKIDKSNLPDPVCSYSISIGDVYMCKWSGEEENWESKSNDPTNFPYHKDTLTASMEP